MKKHRIIVCLLILSVIVSLASRVHAQSYWSTYQTFTGDVNGDGRADLIWNSLTDINRTYIALGNANGTFTPLPPQDRDERYWEGFRMLTADVNGDGRADLIWNGLGDTNVIYVSLGQRNGLLSHRLYQARKELYWQGFRALTGDVNGDKRTDLIWNGLGEMNIIYVSLGQRNGTFSHRPYQARKELYWGDFTTFTGDVNGDGRTDLIWNGLGDTNAIYVSLGQRNGSFARSISGP
jgi:hypothetical protein